jgi:hypothetical protein
MVCVLKLRLDYIYVSVEKKELSVSLRNLFWKNLIIDVF